MGPHRSRSASESRIVPALLSLALRPFDPDLKEIKKKEKKEKVLSREGTKLKFVTGPRLAHEHGENRAQKDDLMAEPEILTPPSSPDPNT